MFKTKYRIKEERMADGVNRFVPQYKTFLCWYNYFWRGNQYCENGVREYSYNDAVKFIKAHPIETIYHEVKL